MSNDMEKAIHADELMQAMRPVNGEMRVVYECKECGQLQGHRFIPFGLGRGMHINSCMCQLTSRNVGLTRILECRP